MSEREKQLLVESLQAIKDACRKSHKGGLGGAAICICGAGGGGSMACRALGVFSQLVRYGELPKEEMEVLRMYL